jgi:hypothetical protein
MFNEAYFPKWSLQNEVEIGWNSMLSEYHHTFLALVAYLWV